MEWVGIGGASGARGAPTAGDDAQPRGVAEQAPGARDQSGETGELRHVSENHNIIDIHSLFYCHTVRFRQVTRFAREVLEDCRGAVEEIGNGVQGRAWRRRWVAAVVLLRTVGHVLGKIDANISPNYKRAIEAAWTELGRTKPQPEIFWAFINAERNNIIHEYEVGAGQGVTVQIGQDKSTEHHYLMNTGPFAGRDQREVLRKAIAWWETYLDGVDREANQ